MLDCRRYFPIWDRGLDERLSAVMLAGRSLTGVLGSDLAETLILVPVALVRLSVFGQAKFMTAVISVFGG